MDNNVKKAIVVGASSGLGREVARLLLQRGWMVGVAARREALLDELAQEFPGMVTTARIDVTQPAAASDLRDLVERHGGIDLLFYASGIGKQNRTLEPDIELSTVETNALGFTRVVGEAFRIMAEQRHGHIACITSIAGTKGLGPAPSYSATKAFQNCYIQALEQQAQQRRLDIRFTDLRPGFVDTDLLADGNTYPMLLAPARVAQEIVESIERRRHTRVIDWRWRIVTALWRRIPRPIWRRLRL